jgi:transcriptional regulator
MYQPKLFLETDRERIARLVGANPFATLVSTPDGGAPTADHVPLLLEDERGPQGTLVGHVARANPLWREMQSGRSVLAIFHGPHAYVPSVWYGNPEEHVPTWNYAVVHARAKPRVIESSEAILALLRKMVSLFQPEGHPLDPPAPLAQELSHAIVAFELEVERWEAKLKLSQNREPDDRARVQARLRTRAQGDDLAVAELMRELAESSPKPSS